MNAAPNTRRLACEFFVIAAVCGAGYYFLVDGAHAKIASVRADVAKAQQEEASRAGVGGLSDGQVSDLQRTTAERASEMRARSAPASDEATMFARMSELATTHSVRLEQLNPIQASSGPAQRVVLPPGVQSGTPAAAGAQAAGAAPADGPAPAKDIRVAYSLSVSGTYTDLAAFIAALSDRLGYTIVKSVRLSQPDLHTPDSLRAAIQTEHISLDLSAIKLPSSPPVTTQPMPVSTPSGATVHAPEHASPE